MPVTISRIVFMTLALGLGSIDWRGASADTSDSGLSNAPVAASGSDTRLAPLANRPPRVKRRVPDQTVQEGAAFSYRIPGRTFRDPDGDSLRITAQMRSNWLSFDQPRRRVVGTPLTFDAPALVRVRATDQQGASATTSFQVRIRPRTLGDQTGQSTPSPDFDGTTDSTEPSISGNGRFVAHLFESAEVEEQSIVVRDFTVADISGRGSFTVAGPAAFDAPALAKLFSSPSISADGRTVAFVAQTAPEAEIQEVEIRVVRIVNSEPLELETKFVQSILRSDDPIEREELVRSTDVSLSANGRFVAFEQGADVVVAKIGTIRQLVIRDASSPSISGNGRRIAYEEVADFERRIFVATLDPRNMTAIETVEAGFDIDSDFGPRPSNPVVSANGRFVAFESEADELVFGDNNGARDIFVYNIINPRTTRVNVDGDGDEGDADSSNPSLSKNGVRIAFVMTTPGIDVFGQQISIEQVFVRELDRDGEPIGELRMASVNSDRVPGNGSSAAPAQSGDGRFVAFESRSSNLTTDARANQGTAVFLAPSFDDSRPVVDLPLDSLDDPGTQSLVLGIPTQGTIDPAFDVDPYSVQLIVGQAYRFVLQADDSNGTPLADAYLEIYAEDGLLLAAAGSGGGLDARLDFTAPGSFTAGNIFFVLAYGGGEATGDYLLIGDALALAAAVSR